MCGKRRLNKCSNVGVLFVLWVFFPPPPYHQQIHPFYVGICLHIYIKMNKKKGRKIFSGSVVTHRIQLKPRSPSHTLPRLETLLLTLSVTFRQLFFFAAPFCGSFHFQLQFVYLQLIPPLPPVQSSPVQSSYQSEPRPAPTDSCPLCILAFIPAPTHNLFWFLFSAP